MNLNQLFSHWDIVREGLLDTVQKFSEAELDERPFANSWSVREILYHIANTEAGWIHFGIRGELSTWPTPYTAEEYPTIPDIIELLTTIHTQTKGWLAMLTLANLSDVVSFGDGEIFTVQWIIWHVLEHEIHHRGELSLFLGQLGREGLDV